MDSKNTALKTSVRMAVVMGIFLPFAETIRSIHEILALKGFFHWFDDYILGAILLAAALNALSKNSVSIAYLIAAWGIAAGAIGLSLWAHLNDYLHGEGLADRGVFSSGLVLTAKAFILAFILVGLYTSTKANGPEIKK